jgi:hypothetical protein
LAYRCDSGYRKREGHPSRFGSRTGHESCPFIRLLSVRSIETDTSLGEISMTLVMTMSVEYLAVAKGISSPLTLWDKMIDFPDISILEDESTVAAFPLLIFECKSRLSSGSYALLMIRPPGAVKDPKTEEIKAGSTIALSFDQFQAMHLALCLALTVFERERRAHRIIVPK